MHSMFLKQTNYEFCVTLNKSVHSLIIHIAQELVCLTVYISKDEMYYLNK